MKQFDVEVTVTQRWTGWMPVSANSENEALGKVQDMDEDDVMNRLVIDDAATTVEVEKVLPAQDD
jgi:hypothetical protein